MAAKTKVVYLNLPTKIAEKLQIAADNESRPASVKAALIIANYFEGVCIDLPANVRTWLEKDAQANMRTLESHAAWIIADAAAKSAK